MIEDLVISAVNKGIAMAKSKSKENGLSYWWNVVRFEYSRHVVCQNTLSQQIS